MTDYLHILDASGNKIPAAALTADYEASSTGHRMSVWGMSSTGPNAALSGASGTMRNRARNLERNNSLIHGGVDSLVSNLVGTDISPRWQLANKEQKEELQDLWADSQLELDYNETTSFYGQQAQVARAMVLDGEVLGRLRSMSPSRDRLLVPLQVQLLEADHLDLTYNDIAPNGNEIRHSIEWDKRGKKAAYWLWQDHPGENYLTSSLPTRVRVKKADIAHVFRGLRPGQCRGVSWLSSVLVKLHDIDQYDDAEVVRKKTASMWGGFIYSDTPVPPGKLGGQDGGKTESGQQVLKMEAGAFPQLPNGYKVQFSEPADVGPNYGAFLKTQFRLIARGLGITYEQLTGDLEGVSFSSIRAGLIEFRRLVDTIRLHIMVHQFCRPVINRWLDAAVMSGALQTISLKEYLANPRLFRRIKWQAQGWEYVDPLKDRMAEQMDIRNGLDSRTQIVARRGSDVEQVDKEIAADNARTDDLGLVLDSDPRRTAKSGAMQQAEEKMIEESL